MDLSMNPYAVLGLDKDASDEDVRRAYRSKCSSHIPLANTRGAVPVMPLTDASNTAVEANSSLKKVPRAAKENGMAKEAHKHHEVKHKRAHEHKLEKQHHEHNAESHGLRHPGHHAEQEHSGHDHHGHPRLRHRHPEHGHMAEARTEYHEHHAHDGGIERKTGHKGSAFSGYEGKGHIGGSFGADRAASSPIERKTGKAEKFSGIGRGGEGSE